MPLNKIVFALAFVSGVAVAADPPIATGKMLGNVCAACHGTHGKSYDEYMPSLAGIDRQQLVQSMRDYRDDRRQSVVMNRVAKGYSDAEIEALADFFSTIR
ncbi:MAG: c-type cytochrome [Thiotrichales bacterium]